ncbi:MAG: tolB [Parachlamydiales bacterium]|nr:tolB [Parachlamydiales bacterium]
MNHLTSAKSPKINDREWGCISMNTTPFPNVDFRLIWRGEMVHFILSQLLKYFFLLAICTLHAHQELEVRLGTKTHLKPIYLTTLHASTDTIAEDLRSVLAYDLAHNGYSSIVPVLDRAEQKISWPDPLSRVDSSFWKKEQIPIVIAIEATREKFAATLIHIEKGTTKRYREIPIKDRTAIHQLADAIQKDLFGVQGIASLRILFSQRLKNADSRGQEWFSDIWMSDWDGANAKRLTMAKGYCMSPGFFPTPKSSTYYFVSTNRGQSKIYRSSLTDSKVEEWINLRGNQMLPAMAKDGSMIAFITDAAGRPDLFLQPLDSHGKEIGRPRQLFSAPNATQASPTFSPDGRQIAFVSDKEGSPRIYLLDIRDPRESRRPDPKLLTRKNRENTSPAWSPDGKKLAYSARADGVRQIWIYDFASHEEWQLTSGPENKENPAWAPDSLHLIYNTETRDVSELYVINLHQQEPIQINLGFGQKRFASWEIR